jgi:hypothetical protein
MTTGPSYKQLNYIRNLLSDTGHTLEEVTRRACDREVSDRVELTRDEASQVIEWLLEYQEGET